MSKEYDSPSTTVLDIIPEGILCESYREEDGAWN